MDSIPHDNHRVFRRMKIFVFIYVACSFDFEDGIGVWERTGTAFIHQPTFGDNPAARNRESAQQQGDWWIGGAENRPSERSQQDICTKKVPTDPKELSLPLISVSLAEISRFSSVEDVPKMILVRSLLSKTRWDYLMFPLILLKQLRVRVSRDQSIRDFR